MTESVSSTADTSLPEPLFRPALVLMTGRFLGFFAAFAIPMVLARLFEPAEFGTYKQIFLIFGTLFGIAQAGMAESLYYFLPSDPRRGGNYVCNTLLVLGTLGALAFAGLGIYAEEIAQLLNNEDLLGYIPLVGLYLAFMLMAVVLEIVMTVRRQHLYASSAYGLSDLARACCYIVPVLILGDLRALMLGAIAFALARFVAAMMYINREFGTRLRPQKDALKLHLAYAIPFGAAALIEVVQINYHLYAVSYYFDAAVFAIYAVGCLQIPISDFLMTSTCNVMMVNMQEKLKSGDKKAVAAIWLDSVRKLGLIFFPMVVLLLILAERLIIFLFTDTYSESVPIFMVCTLSMLFATLLTDGALRVHGQTTFLIFQNIVRLAIVVIFMPWFLEAYHLIGAIAVTLLATAVSKFIALYRLKRVMDINFRALLPWASLIATLMLACLAAIPAMLISAFLTVNDLVLLALSAMAYALTYYRLILWFGPMDSEEKAMLSNHIMQPICRVGRHFRA